MAVQRGSTLVMFMTCLSNHALNTSRRVWYSLYSDLRTLFPVDLTRYVNSRTTCSGTRGLTICAKHSSQRMEDVQSWLCSQSGTAHMRGKIRSNTHEKGPRGRVSGRVLGQTPKWGLHGRYTRPSHDLWPRLVCARPKASTAEFAPPLPR